MIGDRGPIGRDGATGAEGRAGTTGRDGHEGNIGERGIQGEQGERGVRGRSGGRNAAVAFLILMTFSFFGFVRVEQFQKEAVDAQRDGCRRDNTTRENQGRLLEGQIKLAEPTLLPGGLKNLEPFRVQIQQQQDEREDAVRRLKEAVSDHPVRGEPFHVDCVKAYP